MRRPVLLVVHGHAAAARTISEELRSRYAQDYAIESLSSAADALARLRQLAAAGDDVAVVLAAHDLPDAPGDQLLGQVREHHPRARRGLLLEWGERAAVPTISRALALGRADYFVGQPVAHPDERFHRSVTEFLADWWRERGTGFELLRVVGEERSPRCHEMRDILSRFDLPHGFYASSSEAGQAVLAEVGAADGPLPVVVTRGGQVLRDPSNREVAEALGVSTRPAHELYDVTIVGAGPAGLAAAVYAGSEGLRCALLEREAVGGQAGTSSMIRNYLGFPQGVRGAELAMRASDQATMFGVDIVYVATATGLRAEGDDRVVTLADGTEVRSRCVVLANGVSYRRLGIPALEELLGAGVFYGAAAAEARGLQGERVFVVGGGNSAGQAALHLAEYAEHVTLLVRSASLAESMSDYLITELAQRPGVDVRHRTAVVGGGGRGRLEQLELQDVASGEIDVVPAAALFVMIGAAPRTEWLPADVVRDRWGYVLTGPLVAGWHERRPPLLLETSLPGVFAVGDVRHGSVKRVASAVGDGSIAIRLVHEYLAHHASVATAS